MLGIDASNACKANDYCNLALPIYIYVLISMQIHIQFPALLKHTSCLVISVNKMKKPSSVSVAAIMLLLLFIAGNKMERVEGARICVDQSIMPNPCVTSVCDQKCKAKHSKPGYNIPASGYCTSQCVCFYYCGENHHH